ncbi:acyl-coenzyme A thioesterase 9 [Mytilus galloprovincialis]|nr:acyl-coenzyme A thioesterase 9 [Mytilus galloprovincialis]
MRKAFELAWTSAALYSKSRQVAITTVDDIVFRKPVEIGSLLFLSSEVVYTNGSKLQLKVHAEVVNPTDYTRATTNDFHFTFDTKQEDLPSVIPKTYAEFMLFLDGKRHYES